MKIEDVMTTDVQTCTPETPISKVAQLMKELNVGVIPVCQNERLTGLATDRDLVVNALANDLPSDTPVSEVMTADPVRGTIHMTAEEAADLMADAQIRRLPIVENGNLLGIVSLGDLAVTHSVSDEAGEALEEISSPSNSQAQ